MTATKTEEAPSLAERLDSARKAEAAPRQHVAELQAALSAAETARDWPEAERLEAELRPAQEAAAFASAIVTALADQAAAIERDRRDREAARVKAEQVARAQEVIGEAIAEERQADEEIGACLQQMLAAIESAQAAMRRAQAAEARVGQAKRRVLDQRVILGEIEGVPARFGWPTPATELLEFDPVLQALMKWKGPEVRTPRQVVVGAPGPGSPGRALTQWRR